MSLLRALFSRQVPFRTKLVVIAAVLYGLFPMDALPDIAPIIGWLDDLGILIAALAVFWNRTKNVRTKLKQKA